MWVWEVIYYDLEDGNEGSVYVKASDQMSAIETVEQMGEFEVIECQIVDRD